MKYKVLISQAAEQDIRDAFIWYEKQKNNLGLDFENHINKIVSNILKNPLKFQIRYTETRIAFLKKFPYGIHFFIQEQTMIITAVFHTSKSPKIWKKRTLIYIYLIFAFFVT